jgi:hypothetical protein
MFADVHKAPVLRGFLLFGVSPSFGYVRQQPTKIWPVSTFKANRRIFEANMALLTDIAIRSARSRAKTFKLSDGDGLQLWVLPTSKLWNLAYRFAGKRRRLALDNYPLIGLREARERRGAARKLLAEARTPMAQKRLACDREAVADANTFSVIAGELLAGGALRSTGIILARPLPKAASVQAFSFWHAKIRLPLELERGVWTIRAGPSIFVETTDTGAA